MASSTSALDASTGLTCVTCRLVFANGEVQRQHYRSGFHLYNAKRQVANLCPVTEQDFSEKLQQYSQASATDSAYTSENGTPYCAVCKKKFQSENAYDNHLNSKRHKEKATADEETPADEKVEKKQQPTGEEDDALEGIEEEFDEDEAIPPNDCLFCAQQFDSIDCSLRHMSLSHGFSVPDSHFCTDLKGLLTFLGFKVGVGRTCIRCNCARFRDLEAVQKHMRDSNHCNFRIDDDDAGGGDVLLDYVDFYDYGQLYDEDGEGSEQIAKIFDDGSFLVLPSGARIGHRSLMRYFRQKLRPVQEEGADHPKMDGRSSLTGKLKQLGWTGTTGALAVAHMRDMAWMRRTVDRYKFKQSLASNKLFFSRGRDDQM